MSVGRAVALLSGGLDSGTALAMWRASGGVIDLALFADYGQRAVGPEERAARALAARFGVAWRRVELPWLEAAAHEASSALVGAAELPAEGTPETPGDAASAARVWVPARNVVLVAAAAAWAEAVGAGFVLVGFNREEAATFADNSVAFRDAMDAALELGTRSAVRVTSPTADLDKPEIVERARRAGLGRTDFWSCYGAGPRECGRCESCLRSARAWARARG